MPVYLKFNTMLEGTMKIYMVSPHIFCRLETETDNNWPYLSSLTASEVCIEFSKQCWFYKNSFLLKQTFYSTGANTEVEQLPKGIVRPHQPAPEVNLPLWNPFEVHITNNSDITWSSWAFDSVVHQLFVQHLSRSNLQENIKYNIR